MAYERKSTKYTKKTACTLETMNVTQIRYTQNTISDTFSDGTPLQHTINMLKTNKIKAHNIPPIRVGFYRGYYRTIDNRRLYCFKSSNIKKISVKRIRTIDNPEFHIKNTSKNDGQRVTVRNAGNAGDFYCDICDKSMTLGDKVSHLNGKRHQNVAQKKYKERNAKKSWKPKMCPGAYARELELKQTISKKTKQIKNLNIKLQQMEAQCKDCNAKKLNCVENVTEISWKPTDMELEQIISKKTKEMKQIYIVGFVGNVLFVCCVFGLCLYFKKYI